MQAKRGRPPKHIVPIATTPIEPLKIVPPPKPRRRLETFEGSNLEDIVKLADKLSPRWPKTAEALFAAGWIFAVEIYDECTPKIEGKS